MVSTTSSTRDDKVRKNEQAKQVQVWTTLEEQLKSMPFCCVFKCCGKLGHRFPKDPMLRQSWVDAVRRRNWSPSKYSIVCYKHFKYEDYIQESYYLGTQVSRRTLKTGTIPSVFPWSVDSRASTSECQLQSLKTCELKQQESQSSSQERTLSLKDIAVPHRQPRIKGLPRSSSNSEVETLQLKTETLNSRTMDSREQSNKHEGTHTTENLEDLEQILLPAIDIKDEIMIEASPDSIGTHSLMQIENELCTSPTFKEEKLDPLSDYTNSVDIVPTVHATKEEKVEQPALLKYENNIFPSTHDTNLQEPSISCNNSQEMQFEFVNIKQEPLDFEENCTSSASSTDVSGHNFIPIVSDNEGSTFVHNTLTVHRERELSTKDLSASDIPNSSTMNLTANNGLGQFPNISAMNLCSNNNLQLKNVPTICTLQPNENTRFCVLQVTPLVTTQLKPKTINVSNTLSSPEKRINILRNPKVRPIQKIQESVSKRTERNVRKLSSNNSSSSQSTPRQKLPYSPTVIINTSLNRNSSLSKVAQSAGMPNQTKLIKNAFLTESNVGQHTLLAETLKIIRNAPVNLNSNFKQITHMPGNPKIIGNTSLNLNSNSNSNFEQSTHMSGNPKIIGNALLRLKLNSSSIFNQSTNIPEYPKIIRSTSLNSNSNFQQSTHTPGNPKLIISPSLNVNPSSNFEQSTNKPEYPKIIKSTSLGVNSNGKQSKHMPNLSKISGRSLLDLDSSNSNVEQNPHVSSRPNGQNTSAANSSKTTESSITSLNSESILQTSYVDDSINFQLPIPNISINIDNKDSDISASNAATVVTKSLLTSLASERQMQCMMCYVPITVSINLFIHYAQYHKVNIPCSICKTVNIDKASQFFSHLTFDHKIGDLKPQIEQIVNFFKKFTLSTEKGELNNEVAVVENKCSKISEEKSPNKSQSRDLCKSNVNPVVSSPYNQRSLQTLCQDRPKINTQFGNRDNKYLDVQASSTATVVTKLLLASLESGEQIQCMMCNARITASVNLFIHYAQYHKIGISCPLCKTVNIEKGSQFFYHITFDHNIVYVRSQLEQMAMFFKQYTYSKGSPEKQQFSDKVVAVTEGKCPTNSQESVVEPKKCVEVNNPRCILCDVYFISNLILWEHLKTVHKYCITCCVCFDNSTQLVIHLADHSSRKIMFFRCKQCRKGLKTMPMLIDHYKSHTGNAALQSLRPQEFESFPRPSLQLYSRRHCPYCCLFIRGNEPLNTHVNMHKILRCKRCCRQFVWMYIKNCEIPNFCTICEHLAYPNEINTVDTSHGNNAYLNKILEANRVTGIPDYSYLGEMLLASRMEFSDGTQLPQTRYIVRVLDDQQQGCHSMEDVQISRCPPTSNPWNNEDVASEEYKRTLLSSIPKNSALYEILYSSSENKKEKETPAVPEIPSSTS